MTDTFTRGTVISGTLRAQDLLPCFLNELAEVSPADYREVTTRPYQRWERYETNDEYWESEAPSEDIWELMDMLCASCPDGYYFGAHFDDGAHFGYWPVED